MKCLIQSIILVLSCQRINSWGIPDWDDASDVYDDFTDGATSTWNALSASVSEGVDDTTQFLSSISDSPILNDVISSIQEVITLGIDTIEEAVQGFNVTTWEKLAKDAKYVIYNLPNEIQTYIAIGCNYLSELADMEFIPFPLNVIENDDFYSVTDCVADNVFDLAVDWTNSVATTYISIVGQGGTDTTLDFSPLLNTEIIATELNDTYVCLFKLLQDIEQRDREDNVINLFEEATDFFEFDNLAITIQISFTACTLTCGTAALGFAQSSTDFNQHRPFYTVSMGVDSSSVVGASIGAEIGFKKNFSQIAGSDHTVSFGVGIELPLLPDIGLPDVGVELSAEEGSEGEFGGFSLASDIIDFQFGLDGAFSLGYAFSETKWVYTTDDLKEAWNAVEDIVDEKVENVNGVAAAYNTLTNSVLGNGGYFVKAAKDEITSLMCPSGISDQNHENTHIGNLSVLQLGAMDIYDVVFGNVEGDNECNSTTGYDTVRNLCQYASECSIPVNEETLGSIPCDASDLTVIYGCPDQLDVFNLGCYDVNFLTVIDKSWFQDYNDPILDDGWQARNNGMAKCAKIAQEKGYAGFATYNNGMCLMAKNLFKNGVYNELGTMNGTVCPLNGLGNDVSMNLYAFANGEIAYDDLGCINKTQIAMYNSEYNKNLETSFDEFEGEHYLFQEQYKDRRNAISKCAQVANEKGYKGFAMFDGGKCFISNQLKSEVINEIRQLSNVDNSTTLSCSKGTDYAYNVFQFPYVDIDQESSNEGLSAGEIALIVILPIIVIGLAVVGCLLGKKYITPKQKKSNSKPPSSHNNL